MSSNNCNRKFVQFDVGGTLYKVSRATLELCEGSMLASLVSDKWKQGNSDQEAIFIDRNGRLFEYVLDYLRTNEVYLPPSVSRDAVEEELAFYGIDADMSKVNGEYGIEFVNASLGRLHELKALRLALQASTLVEFYFLKSYSACSSFLITLTNAEYPSIRNHESLLSQCLLAKGFELVSSNVNSLDYEVTVKRIKSREPEVIEG